MQVSISLCERVELQCPRCGRSFDSTVWRIVDAAERPDLRELVLLGRLNLFHCPSCGNEGGVEAALLYHDAAHQAVLLALPAGEVDEAAVRALADPLVEALHRAIPDHNRHPYLYNVQLAGSIAGLAAEIRSWGGVALGAERIGPNEGCMEIDFLDAQDSSWSDRVDHLRRLLGAPANPNLFPPQFVKVAFPRMGGRIACVRKGGQLVGVGFLFPRGIEEGRQDFTLRFHTLTPDASVDPPALVRLLEQRLGESHVTFYLPEGRHSFEQTGQQVGGLEIGRPDEAEAQQVRSLQQEIWRNESDLLYPADIHSIEFHAGTSLVARQDAQIVGFLFGFLKFGGAALPAVWDGAVRQDLRVESQVLGVSPTCRAKGIGFLLKKAQAEQAQENGIDIVNWTVDPLQCANAVLNFSKLRALAFHFYPDYYPIRNALNQVPASRLVITWLVNSRRVQQALHEQGGRSVTNLAGDNSVQRVNSGYSERYPAHGAPSIAFEIPVDWTALQRDDRAAALRWRQVTDRLFEEYLGVEVGRYVICGVGEDGEHRYLVAEQVGEEALERLGM